MITSETKKLPAEIPKGIEAFWNNNEKWVIHEGRIKRFHDAPGTVQRAFANAFLNDKKSRNYLRKIGITNFSEAFDLWYRCVIGDLYSTPDLMNDSITSEEYNNSNADINCPPNGELCNLKPGLKNYEVATISALRGGFTLQQTADLLCISLSGLKSRVKKIKEKLGATNMASLIAKADAYGI